jgi:aspartate kinase
MEGVVVSGATVQKNMAEVGLVGVDNKPGNAAKIFAHLAQAKVVVNDIMQTELSAEKANLSFTISASDLNAAKKAAEQIKDEVNCESIFVREDIAEISVVGVGMRNHYGVADTMFGALAKAKVNIDSITTSEIRISCVVGKEQADKALIAVCEAFDLDKPANKRVK